MDPKYDVLLKVLLAYGFSEELSKQALAAVGTSSVEDLFDWLAFKEPASLAS